LIVSLCSPKHHRHLSRVDHRNKATAYLLPLSPAVIS